MWRGGKARRRAGPESTARKAKVQVRARSSAGCACPYVHTPSSSSISGGSKRLHGKKEMSAEREEGSKTGWRTKETKEWGWLGLVQSCNLHIKSVDPKRKALREVPGSARCIVPDQLGDYRAKRGCTERGQSWVRAFGQHSLGLEVAPFSEISRAVQEGYLDEKGGRRKTRAGWEGFCVPDGLRDDAQSAYSACRASWEQIRAQRVRQSPRLHGGLVTSGQTVSDGAGREEKAGKSEARWVIKRSTGGVKVPLPSPRSRPAAEPAFSPSASASSSSPSGVSGPEESVTLVCVREEGVFCGGFGHRASEVEEEEMFGCV
ncbi:hypothetical protein B0H14DRAFT_2584270 [Mycena olivaceomarginata]|nr:hypothetical protein B0H14DRAFT_2584270 [Mycena olivaceomarginata]